MIDLRRLLHPDSPGLSTRTGPAAYQSQRLAWTVPPQGSRDGPHVFEQALASDLAKQDLHPSTRLRGADGPSSVARPIPCGMDTELGSRIIWLKADMESLPRRPSRLPLESRTSVSPLRHDIAPSLWTELTSPPAPLASHLRSRAPTLSGSLHTWVPNFSGLYPASTGPLAGPLGPAVAMRPSSRGLRQARPPAQPLPSPTPPDLLHSHHRRGRIG